MEAAPEQADSQSHHSEVAKDPESPASPESPETEGNQESYALQDDDDDEEIKLPLIDSSS